MPGPKAAAQTLRAVLLVGMVVVLPMTAGWITLYVLGGIVLLFGLGCCCCNCCIGDLCDCDCSGCGCGCGGGACCLDDCCDGCGDGDCDCCGDGGGTTDGGGGDGTGDCGCVQSLPPDVASAAATLPLVVPLVRGLPAHWLSHHPDTPRYEQDTYSALGLRWCIGCFTTHPIFLAASAWLALAPPGGAWWAWSVGGVGLASLQAVSSMGRARTRWQKVLVKTCLGLGLAFAVHGVLVAPWSIMEKQTVLLGLLALAASSAVPRALRMRRSPT